MLLLSVIQKVLEKRGRNIFSNSEEKINKFIGIEGDLGGSIDETIIYFKNNLTLARERFKQDIWTEKPLIVVEVDNYLIVIDGHHRLKAAKEIGFKGKIPYNKISIEDSGYTLSELREVIK